METFSSGAKSTEKKPRYDLLPIEGIQRGAARMTMGASSHGDRNFEKGVDDAVFVKDRENHLVEHALLYAAGDRSTDHLGAIIANASMLARLEAIRDSRIQNAAKPRHLLAGVCSCSQQGDGCGQ